MLISDAFLNLAFFESVIFLLNHIFENLRLSISCKWSLKYGTLMYIRAAAPMLSKEID